MLYVDPAGSVLHLSVFGAGEVSDLLAVPIQWQAGAWHQVGLVCSAGRDFTELYLDGQPVAKGPGMGPLEQLVSPDKWGLCLGGDQKGGSLAPLPLT